MGAAKRGVRGGKAMTHGYPSISPILQEGGQRRRGEVERQQL